MRAMMIFERSLCWRFLPFWLLKANHRKVVRHLQIADINVEDLSLAAKMMVRMGMGAHERYGSAKSQAEFVLAGSQPIMGMFANSLHTPQASTPIVPIPPQLAAPLGGSLQFCEMQQARVTAEAIGSDEAVLWLQQHLHLAKDMSVQKLLEDGGMPKLPHRCQLEEDVSDDGC